MDQFIKHLHSPDYLLLTSSFIIGITGSLHCLSMCGVFASTCGDNTKKQFFYQIGRLLGYLTIGFIIYWPGKNLFNFSQSIISILFSLFMGFFYMFLGINIYKNKNIKFSFPNFVQNKLNQYFGIFYKIDSKFLIGFFSIFLPCGLLYSFLLTLISSSNYFVIVMSVFLFWLGTVPILFFSSTFIKKFILPIVSKIPRIAGILIILTGLFYLGLRTYPLLLDAPNNTRKCPNCHWK